MADQSEHEQALHAAAVRAAAYRRADQDLAFLQRPELRAGRLQLEYLKPELMMSEQEIASTIVLFGGTRVVAPAEAEQQLEVARQAVADKPGDTKRRRWLQVAEQLRELSRYYDVAYELAKRVAQAEVARGRPREFVIMTGGGPGIMEAGNRGAAESGAPTIGLNIQLPREQEPNPYITPELCFQFRYFALRKLHFLMRAKALVAFPGGFGTLDELFDALCLVQTGKMAPIPIILVGRAFWAQALSFEFLAAQGVVDPEDLDLFVVVDSAEEVWEQICERYDVAHTER